MGQKDNLLTAKEFAARSGLTVNQVTKMLRTEKIKGHKQSGRWMISASELPSSGKQPPAAKPAKAPASKPAQSPRAMQTYTVSEFSEKTYLTETGVRRWLAQGRLRGTRSSDGQWQVDAASPELPAVRHLMRS